MAIPTVFAVGTSDTTTGAAAPGIPTGTVADDCLFLVCESDPVVDSAPIGTVTGYTDVTPSPVSQTGGLPTRLTVRWHRATGSESGTVSVPDAGDHVVTRIIGVRGCVTQGNPWNITDGRLDSTTSTTISWPSLVTTADDCLMMLIASTGTDVLSTTHVSGYTNAGLSSLTEQADNWSASGTGGGLVVATGGKAVKGATGATTATLVTGNFKALFTMALQGVSPNVPKWRGLPPGTRRLTSVSHAANW